MGQGKGGGPKTARGKAVSSANAMNHSLTSRAPVLPHVEKARDWKKFRLAIIESLEPTGALEEELAETAALTLWRLRRVARYEHESIEASQAGLIEHLQMVAGLEGAGWPPQPEERYEELFLRYWRQSVIPSPDVAERIARWEGHLQRQLRAALRELRLVQTFRREGKHGVWVAVRRE